MGAAMQKSLRITCPVSQAGGADRIVHSGSKPSKIGSQFENETRPMTFSNSSHPSNATTGSDFDALTCVRLIVSNLE